MIKREREFLDRVNNMWECLEFGNILVLVGKYCGVGIIGEEVIFFSCVIVYFIIL